MSCPRRSHAEEVKLYRQLQADWHSVLCQQPVDWELLEQIDMLLAELEAHGHPEITEIRRPRHPFDPDDIDMEIPE